MQGRQSFYFFLFFLPLFAHIGEFAMKVRLGQVQRLLGRRLDAGQAVICRAGGHFIFNLI